MTESQRVHLMADLWPAAAQAQHWPANDRCKRLSVLSDILGRDITSANDIVSNDDFTKVKNELLRLGHSLAQSDPCATRREKVRRQLKCLALYLDGLRPILPLTPLDPRLRRAEAYIRAIIADSSHRAGYEPQTYDGAPLDDLLQELSLEQLNRLVMTLDNRLHNKRRGFRVQAGHTLHDMLIRAGLPCHCRDCLPRKPVLVETPF